MKTLFFLLVVLLMGELRAEIVPATNRITWNPGVRGGIPSGGWPIYTNLPVNPDGVAGASAIQSALNNCPTGQVVRLSNGVHVVAANLEMPSFVVLRGMGPTNTFLVPSNSAGQLHWTGGGGRLVENIVSGAERGSTNLLLAATPLYLYAGCHLYVSETNAPWVTGVSTETPGTTTTNQYSDYPDNGTRLRGQWVKVHSITTSNLVTDRPLYTTLTSAGRIEYYASLDGVRNMGTGGGVESLCISNTALTNTVVHWERGAELWVSNVVFEVGVNAQPAIKPQFTVNCEIRHSTFRGQANNASAIVPYVKNSDLLIVDNIFQRVYQAVIMVGGGGGNVVAYNFVQSVTNSGTQLPITIGSHGAHPQFTLYEGNVFHKFHADAIHGSSSHNFLLRNYLLGRETNTSYGAGMLWFDETNYWNYALGNIMGDGATTNGMGWVHEISSTSAADSSAFAYQWRFAYTGYNPHSADGNVKGTTIRHGNWNAISNRVDWEPTIADRVIPDSLWLSAKPGWYGTNIYPAMDYATGTPTEIPAQTRFIYGPAEAGPSPGPGEPSAGRAVRAVRANVGRTITP